MSSKNPITLEVLEVLDAIDRRGSYAKAAEELNKATSALSYSVQKLEENLNIALFQRQGRRAVLTPAGQLLLEEGRRILKLTNKLANNAKELATGWEPLIRIAVESLQSYPVFFKALAKFLEKHPSVEIDISESVLNGGWEALEHDRVDLIVGAPGPVPLQKGYRSISLGTTHLTPVIAAHHPQAALASDKQALQEVLPKIRRIVTHDTSMEDIDRSEGLSDEGQKMYLQNMDQKVVAIMAGIGIGHVPAHRIKEQLKNGSLLELNLDSGNKNESFLAWKISNKGKGLQALTALLSKAKW
jgi:DNA-binding transcriptional LysR family regulator